MSCFSLKHVFVSQTLKHKSTIKSLSIFRAMCLFVILYFLKIDFVCQVVENHPQSDPQRHPTDPPGKPNGAPKTTNGAPMATKAKPRKPNEAPKAPIMHMLSPQNYTNKLRRRYFCANPRLGLQIVVYFCVTFAYIIKTKLISYFLDP